LNFIVKARESKLIDLSKKNAELAANNSEMKRLAFFVFILNLSLKIVLFF